MIIFNKRKERMEEFGEAARLRVMFIILRCTMMF